MATGTPATKHVWDINIVGHDVKPASWFLANEKNFRVHPKAQTDATRGSLNELGWIKSVTINKRTDPSWGAARGVETLLDGHDRIKIALQMGEDTPVPIEYVDLTEPKENIALLILDELTAMAVKDKEKMAALIGEVKPQDAALQQMCSLMAAKEGMISINDPADEWQGMPEFVHEDQTSAYRVIVHFATDSDMQDFEELIGQKIPANTKAIWFPRVERDVVRGERYISEEP